MGATREGAATGVTEGINMHGNKSRDGTEQVAATNRNTSFFFSFFLTADASFLLTPVKGNTGGRLPPSASQRAPSPSSFLQEGEREERRRVVLAALMMDPP